MIFETINELDSAILLAINGAHTPVMDSIMKMISGKLIWAPMYASLLYVMLRRFDWRTVIVMAVGIAATIALADNTCAALIRPMFERLRPSNLENPLSAMVHIVDGYRGGAYGFPSCHAANTFALAVFSSMMLRRRAYTIFIFIWAAIVCYSRMYLGVHYPGDILVGGIVGAAAGCICYFAAKYACTRLKLNPLPSESTAMTDNSVLAVAILTLIFVIIRAFV